MDDVLTCHIPEFCVHMLPFYFENVSEAFLINFSIFLSSQNFKPKHPTVGEALGYNHTNKHFHNLETES